MSLLLTGAHLMIAASCVSVQALELPGASCGGGGGGGTVKPKPRFATPYIEQLTGQHAALIRCESDQITSSTSARARIDWAYRCNLLDRATYELEFTHAWNRQTKAWEPLPPGVLHYPVFVHLDAAGRYPSWIPNLSSCAVPADVTFYDICMSGCYRGDQKLLFADGWQAMQDVNGDAAVITVDGAQSSFEQLVFKAQALDYVLRSEREETQTLIHFRTQAGALVVTADHPLVNAEGFMQSADRFQSGESLVRADGSLDPILDKTYEEFFGKVYNLAPASEDPADHIVIAEGFLNGSHRFQEGAWRDLRAVILKRNPIVPREFNR